MDHTAVRYWPSFGLYVKMSIKEGEGELCRSVNERLLLGVRWEVARPAAVLDRNQQRGNMESEVRSDKATESK